MTHWEKNHMPAAMARASARISHSRAIVLGASVVLGASIADGCRIPLSSYRMAQGRTWDAVQQASLANTHLANLKFRVRPAFPRPVTISNVVRLGVPTISGEAAQRENQQDLSASTSLVTA